MESPAQKRRYWTRTLRRMAHAARLETSSSVSAPKVSEFSSWPTDAAVSYQRCTVFCEDHPRADKQITLMEGENGGEKDFNRLLPDSDANTPVPMDRINVKCEMEPLNNFEISHRSPPSKPPKRGQWSSKREFILAVVGEIIGLGNVWRFPYLCFKNGGGVFLVPYVLFLLTCGIPIFFLEVSLGQMTGQGGITCWRQICPLFEGIGYGGQVIMLYTVMYYIVILAWAFLYLFSSFHSELPWASCNNTWNTVNCIDYRLNQTWNASLSINATSSAEEFWQRRVLGLSGGIEEMGSIRWDLAGCLLLSWIVCYFCIWKGVKSSGKVWMDAASQILFSYAVCTGCLASLGSYNQRNNNCYKDAFILCLLNSSTSFFAGFAIFSVLGYMSYELGVSINTVAESGPGLAFIAYPRAVAMMPLPQLWSFVYLEGLVTSISDMYPSFFFTGHRRKVLLLVICGVSFAVGLCMVTEGGLYVFQLFDYYACSGIPLVLFAILESICIGWVYGADLYYSKVSNMIGYHPWPYMKYCWKFVTPALSIGVLLFFLIQFKPLKYNSYVYPAWGYGLGLFLAFSSVAMAPLWFLYKVATTPGTLKQKLRKGMMPSEALRPS
ncbi:hypothetical protein WMY93_000889 [Mugilogobius chulae]|uniref:Transporter n=1 Tax=Mugilogobius chulae TaxID=88201 RepID=A0AAW0Q256_9GOBI